MTLGAILGAALNTGAAHPYTLTINGVDMIPPAGVASTVQAPVPYVHVTHAAPGEVSSMNFRVENTGNTFTVSVGDVVLLWDNTRNRPVFYGFVQTPTTSRLGVGRAVDITAAGVDIMLDWLVLAADVTFPVNMFISDAMQSAYALCAGVGVPLNTQQAARTGTNRGNQSQPVGDMLNAGLLAALTITAGTSLRNAIAQLWQAGLESVGSQNGPTYSATVDMYGGLRVWGWLTVLGIQAPSDYATFTITDTYASTLNAGDLAHTIDGGAVVRGIVVVGGNAAGSGVVTDGTGKPGAVVKVTDATSTTAAKRDAIAASALAAAREQPVGTFNLLDFTPIVDIYPGSPIALTDAQVLQADTFRVSQLERSFLDIHEDWTVTYGLASPSYVNTA